MFQLEPHRYGRSCKAMGLERGLDITHMLLATGRDVALITGDEGAVRQRLRRVAGRTAHPQEPMPCLERTANRRREQHWHRLACRSFHAAMRRLATSRIWASVARFAAASFSAAAARCASILRRLNPMLRISPRRYGAESSRQGYSRSHSPPVGAGEATLATVSD